MFLSFSLFTSYFRFTFVNLINASIVRLTDENFSRFFPTVVLMDEDDIEEDLDEDLDIGTEMDPDSPPWDMYGEPDIDDIDDSNEDTALLRVKAARTEIIVTPISPVTKWISRQASSPPFIFSFYFVFFFVP